VATVVQRASPIQVAGLDAEYTGMVPAELLGRRLRAVPETERHPVDASDPVSTFID
jgi:hypothetical protein